jgi:hypothetical protein
MDQDTLNSFFYAFSTIAQVIAAFLALSGVFLVLIIQQKKKKILYHAGKIRIKAESLFNELNEKERIPHTEIRTDIIYLKEFIENESLPGVFQQLNRLEHNELLHMRMKIKLKEDVKNFEDNHLAWVMAFAQLKHDRNHFENSIKYTKKAFILGFISIVLSLIVIPLVPEIADKNHLNLIVLFSIILACTSMIYLLKVIFLLFRIELKLVP